MSAAEPTIETIARERYVPEGMRAVWVSIILVMSPSPGVSVASVNVRAASIYFSFLSSERGAISARPRPQAACRRLPNRLPVMRGGFHPDASGWALGPDTWATDA